MFTFHSTQFDNLKNHVFLYFVIHRVTERWHPCSSGTIDSLSIVNINSYQIIYINRINIRVIHFPTIKQMTIRCIMGMRCVNDQDEVGFASSKRCENERRLTLNTDCIYRLRLVGERFIDVLHPVKRGMGVSLVQHPQPDLGAFREDGLR